jgi:hypothetical protein
LIEWHENVFIPFPILRISVGRWDDQGSARWGAWPLCHSVPHQRKVVRRLEE